MNDPESPVLLTSDVGSDVLTISAAWPARRDPFELTFSVREVFPVPAKGMQPNNLLCNRFGEHVD